MIRGCIRTSGEEKREASPETQRGMIARYADGQPIMWYEDIGYSGGDANRPGFKRAEEEAVAGDEVVYSSQDRFCRDLEFYLVKTRQLKERGIRVVFADNPHLEPETRQGRLSGGVRALVDQDYRLGIEEKIAAARARPDSVSAILFPPT